MAGREPAPLSIRCERARHWASLRLDGELSALENQLLGRHLASCEACRAFDEGAATATAFLRAAPAEVSRHPFRPPARRLARLPVAGRRTALVAAAALALGALTGSLLERPPSSPRPSQAPEVSLLSRDVRQLQQLPRTKRPTTQPPVRSAPPNPPEGVI